MKENIIAYMKTALNTELMGYKFYLHAAEITEDEHGKNIFKHLANDELDHIKAISSIVGSIEETGRVLTYDEALNAYNSRGQGLPIFPEENELIKKLGKNPEDLDALNIAIKSEEDAVHFYGSYLKSAGDANEKVLLTNLLEMEKGHLKLLRWEYDSIVDTGFWCDFMEWTVEGEKE
ncbi:MAG: ferritin family protein [Deltaproteobacteria bacterium]|nr:ferritin family protein [Deltaproteobacteria bacterium]